MMYAECIHWKEKSYMESKKIIRVRMSKQLKEKVIKEAQKRKKRNSAYAREQLEGTVPFREKNLDIINQKLNGEIFDIGLKINYKARLFNTYGALQIDMEIHQLLIKILNELSNIIGLLRDASNLEEKKLSEDEGKKISSLPLAVDEEMYMELKSKAGALKINISELIRNRMENPLKYTKADILILKKQIHYKIYPIISNVEQICFQYAESNIKNIYLEINKLNADVVKIAELENKIIFCLKG